MAPALLAVSAGSGTTTPGCWCCTRRSGSTPTSSASRPGSPTTATSRWLPTCSVPAGDRHVWSRRSVTSSGAAVRHSIASTRPGAGSRRLRRRRRGPHRGGGLLHGRRLRAPPRGPGRHRRRGRLLRRRAQDRRGAAWHPAVLRWLRRRGQAVRPSGAFGCDRISTSSGVPSDVRVHHGVGHSYMNDADNVLVRLARQGPDEGGLRPDHGRGQLGAHARLVRRAPRLTRSRGRPAVVRMLWRREWLPWRPVMAPALQCRALAPRTAALATIPGVPGAVAADRAVSDAGRRRGARRRPR